MSLLRTFVWVATALIAVGSVPLLTVSPAVALSCVPWGDDVDLDAARNALPEFRDDRARTRFTERFDFAVIGRVADVEEAFVGGNVSVTVDVRAGLFARVLPSSIVLSMTDRSYFGYPFKIGTSYFIPVLLQGPQGQDNYVFACDPVTVVDEDQIEEVLAVAAVSGTTISAVAGQDHASKIVPSATGNSPTEGAPADAARVPMTAAVAWTAAVTAAGAAILALRRSRRAIKGAERRPEAATISLPCPPVPPP